MKTSLPDSALLETVLSTVAALVVVLDEEGRVVVFNQACEALTGYRSAEVKGKPIWELLVPEEARHSVVATFEQLLAGQFPNRFENEWITRSGERRVIDWSNSAMVDDAGRVRYVVATGVDITERRVAEARERELLRARVAQHAAEAARDALRLSEEAFSGIVDLCADAIVTIDRAQQIVSFNQGAEEIFGYSVDEVLGQPLTLLLPDKARADHQRHVDHFSASEKPSRRMGERGEIFGQRKNGEVFPAEASISKQLVQGRWLYTAILRDVSEQRRYEEVLDRANRELHRSNSDLEHFAAVASHDLQEPLRKIQAFGERLATKYGETLPERGQDYLARMQNAAGRMSELIDDLLQFSRITTRAQPFESVDLNEIVARALSDLEVRIERTGGTVDVGPLPRLDAEPLQMRLLLQNLIGNALKFHRPNTPPVVRVYEEVGAEAGFCRLVVEDNGVGFDEKYLDRIFDVFQRLHGRGHYEGTGVGLAIVRKIVERHGGTITASSILDEGSRFLITLPLTQSDDLKGIANE